MICCIVHQIILNDALHNLTKCGSERNELAVAINRLGSPFYRTTNQLNTSLLSVIEYKTKNLYNNVKELKEA